MEIGIATAGCCICKAELVGVSHQAVSIWEVNAAVPDTDKLVSLARALDITVDELLGCVPEGEKTPSCPAAPEEKPGWLAVCWYWLGLIPVIWGMCRLMTVTVSLVDVLDTWKQMKIFQDMRFPVNQIWSRAMERYTAADGLVDGKLILWAFLGWYGIALAAIAAGLLIFFLGRRHVRKKYGCK